MGNCPSALRAAILDRNIQEVERLLSKGDISPAELMNNDYAQDCIMEAWKKAPGNAFYYAVSHNTVEIAKVMIDRGADLHSSGKYGETVLHCAVRNGYFTMARVLVDAGCDVTATDDQGRGVIHACAMAFCDTSAILRWLMTDVFKSLEDVNARDFHARTPLHEAAQKGNLEVCQALVELGADVKATSRSGNTPLHEAGARVRPSIWNLLVTHGANVNAENAYGERPRQANRGRPSP